MNENQRHAVAHVRYQVEHATPENPDCCFDYELVATLLSLIASPPEQPAGDPVTGREWQDIETIPQDRPIDGWHKVWKCPVTIAYRSWGDRNAWVEKTLTTEWPLEAFTHWRETSTAPKEETQA